MFPEAICALIFMVDYFLNVSIKSIYSSYATSLHNSQCSQLQVNFLEQTFPFLLKSKLYFLFSHFSLFFKLNMLLELSNAHPVHYNLYGHTA